MKQSAVEWLLEQMSKEGMLPKLEDYHKAKQMEKEQIIKANRDGVDMIIDKKPFITGQEYYNDTYGSIG